MRLRKFIPPILAILIIALAVIGVWLLFEAPEGEGKGVWVFIAIVLIAPLAFLTVLLIRKRLTDGDKAVARGIAARTDCPHCHVRSLEWDGKVRSDVLHDDPERKVFEFCCPRCTGRFEFNHRGIHPSLRPDDLMSRFRGYTDRADEEIRDAGALSRERGDKSAGPEHLFLALDAKGLGAFVLNTLGFPMEGLQKEFQSSCRIEDRELGTFPPFSDKMLEVLGCARRVARSTGEMGAGDEHLLMALARVPSPVSGFLRGKGLTYEAIRKQLLSILNVDESSRPPLSLAAANGNAADVKLLLSGGANVNARDAFGYTSLHWAAYCGEREIADLLIAAGAELEAGEKAGRTPLHLAAAGGYKEVVELLIAKGANVNAGDIFGRTAFQSASSFHPSVQDALRKAGAKEGPSGRGDKGGSGPGMTKDGMPDYPVEDRLRYTPLHWAVHRGEKETAELLISKGADVNARDRGGGTPLELAAYRGDREIAELLLAAGADVNGKSYSQGTPLYGAASGGHKEVVEFLIAKGADINAADIHGWTPLHAAAYHGKPEAAAALVARGADFHVRNKDGRTALQLAVDNLHAAVEEVLRKAGAKE